MRVVDTDNSFISPIDKYGKIPNHQIIIYAKSGFGKGIISEGLAEWFHNHKYLTIVIADPKMENEYAYQMFPPRERYHLDTLKMISQYVGQWKLPKAQNVKLYHPFTFNLPTNRLLPEMNIFTIPFKSLGREEWGLLSEVHGENETISVLLKASEEINNEDGIYSFAHYIQDSVKAKGNKNDRKADWKNFGLEATSGTMKELTKVSNILRPFKKHYFLSKQNNPLNLDWKKLLTDQENYHVFNSNFIGKQEEKVTDFLILYLLEGIIKNKQYLKHPVVIIIPEVSLICPFKPTGHKEFLANSIKKSLKTIRSMGRGMTTILDTQVFNDTDDDVRGSSTIKLYGELGDIKDIEGICKSMNWGKKIKDVMDKAEVPRTYLIQGVKEGSVDDGGYFFFPPTAMHCEPQYNFEEMYREHNKINPEKYPMKSYREIVELMKEDFKDEEQKLKKKVKKKEKELEEIELKKEKEKEQKQKEIEANDSGKSKSNEDADKLKQTRMPLCYEKYNELGSYSKVGKILGIDHKTVKKYYIEYEKILEEKSNLPQF